MNPEHAERIEVLISQFYEVLNNALRYRLKPWSEYESPRMRGEGLASEMVDLANLSIDLEEKLSLMLITQQHVDMLWEERVGEYLAKPHFSKEFTSFKETFFRVVGDNTDLYGMKKRLDACVDAGKRGVDRLQSLHAVASRGAGIANS